MSTQAAAHDPCWRDLALQSEDALYLVVTEAKSGRTLGKFELTAENASEQLFQVVPTDERVALSEQLRGGVGGCGDLDEITLSSVFVVADHWIAAQQSLLPATGVHELRLRKVGANGPIRAWPLHSVKAIPPGTTIPRTLDDLGAGYKPIEALQRGMINVLEGSGRLVHGQESGHRALDVRGAKIAETAHDLNTLLHDALGRADQRLELLNQRALADLEAQAKRHANEITRLEERHAGEIARIERLHEKEMARLDSLLSASEGRSKELETRLEYVAGKLILVEREGGLEAAEAKNREKIAGEVGQSVRGFVELAAKGAVLYALRDRLTPEMISAATSAMSLGPEALALMSDPRVAELMSDPRVAELLNTPAVQRLLADPEALKALTPFLSNPDMLRSMIAAGSAQ